MKPKNVESEYEMNLMSGKMYNQFLFFLKQIVHYHFVHSLYSYCIDTHDIHFLGIWLRTAVSVKVREELLFSSRRIIGRFSYTSAVVGKNFHKDP